MTSVPFGAPLDAEEGMPLDAPFPVDDRAADIDLRWQLTVETQRQQEVRADTQRSGFETHCSLTLLSKLFRTDTMLPRPPHLLHALYRKRKPSQAQEIQHPNTQSLDPQTSRPRTTSPESASPKPRVWSSIGYSCISTPMREKFIEIQTQTGHLQE